MTEHVVVLQHGVAVESGPLERLLTHPQHPYTASLVASAKTLDAALEVR
jgi:peptide/nickel transport system ATP-binding protein